jgi:hypothetical protein
MFKEESKDKLSGLLIEDILMPVARQMLTVDGHFLCVF